MVSRFLFGSKRTGKAQPKPILLETERLMLRALTPEVLHHLFTACSDDEIMAYMGLKSRADLAREKEQFRQGYSTFFSTIRTFHLLNKSTGAVLGKCGFHTWIPRHRRAEIGYELFLDENKRKGLMTEALGAVLSYGFEQMNLYRIEALIADYNIPSHKLLKHYGFTEEGTIRGHYVVNGVNEDSLMLSSLLPGYEQLKNSWKKTELKP